MATLAGGHARSVLRDHPIGGIARLNRGEMLADTAGDRRAHSQTIGPREVGQMATKVRATTAQPIPHATVEERTAKGAAAREQVPPSSHRGWTPDDERADPVELLQEQNVTRAPDLVPLRHGRMMLSPFTFYRGAAKIMAEDLARTPTAGLVVQLCGDAHLSNFGGFASPERRLLFDLNHLYENPPGPVA